MTITWTIENMTRLTTDGFVTTAYWRATAMDGDYTASAYGSCGWAPETPTIPYADLTQQDVLDWCWADGVDKTAIEASLTANIEAQKNPPIENGVPW
jgi:hypothetical protein